MARLHAKPKLWVGLDQGHTKTALAITNEHGDLLYEDELRTHFTVRSAKPDDIQAARLQKLITQAKPLKNTTIRVIATTNNPLRRSILQRHFSTLGCKIGVFEQASDSLGHYGLTGMKGQTAVFCSGSYYISSYFDAQQNMHLLKWPYPQATTWGAGICAYRYGLAIMDTYALHALSGRHTSLMRAVEQELGPRQGSVYDYLYLNKVSRPHGMIMQLAPLARKFTNVPELSALLQNHAKQAIGLIGLLCDQFETDRTNELILAGAPITQFPLMKKWLSAYWSRSPIHFAKGNPAYGVLRYRLQNPNSRILHHHIDT